MLPYHLKCSKKYKGKNRGQKNKKKKNALCDSKKSGFIKSLSNLELKTPFSKTNLLFDILFKRHKMNKIVNTFLLAEDNFIPELNLRQPGFFQSACGPFIKNKQRI